MQRKDINNMSKLNDTLKEIQEFLQNNNCEYDKSEVIEQCTKGIPDIGNGFLDEFRIVYDEDEYVTNLDDYTSKLFDNFIKLTCNVIESYKDK
jgi:hypothetical protein